MIRYCIFLSLLLASNRPNCQIKGDYNWQLGFGSDTQSNPLPGSLEISFLEHKVVIDTIYRSMYFDYFNASISDDLGSLLLYSNGCQIRNGQHQYVTGTNNLSPGSVDDEWCIQTHIGYPISDGGIFLPFFGDSLIMLLHQRLSITGPPTTVYIDALFYTLVIKNGSTYDLIAKTVPIVEDSLTDGNLEVVKGIDGRGWWAMQSKRNSNIYFAIYLDSAKVDTIISQNIGDITVHQGESAGQAVFSPNGTMYARYTPADDLFLFDFDRNTGLLSNYRKMHVADSGNIGGIAFSSNSRFLYVCARFDLYQFDTWAIDIEESKIHLGHYDGFLDPFPTTFSTMQLGPDCRIYITPPSGGKSMHIIDYPDIAGLNCSFKQHNIKLPTSNSATLPNFPNYRLDIAPPCDPDIVSGFFQFYVPPTPVEIYPIPTNGELWIQLSEAWTNVGAVRVEVVDQLGRRWIQSIIPSGQANFHFDLRDVPAGIYFVQLQSDRQWFAGKVTKL